MINIYLFYYDKMIKPAIVFHPWKYLSDALENKWLSKNDLSQLINISLSEIDDIVEWKQDISPIIAFRLWKVFGNNPKTRLNLQNMYDLYQIEHDTQEIKQAMSIYEHMVSYA